MKQLYKVILLSITTIFYALFAPIVYVKTYELVNIEPSDEIRVVLGTFYFVSIGLLLMKTAYETMKRY